MMPRRGRIIAAACAGIGLVVIAAVALAAARPRMEDYCIDKLRTAGAEDCQRYTEYLVRWGSPRAVPKLLTALGEECRKPMRRTKVFTQALIKIGDPAIPRLVETAGGKDRLMACYAFSALVGMREAALPRLAAILRDTKLPSVTRAAAADALGRMGEAAQSAIPALESMAEDPDGDVRRAALNSVKRIEAACKPRPIGCYSFQKG